MEKPIVAMGMIKNSADVIESFIRGNSLWADCFVLMNNMCTDRTIEILNSLIEEGFKIEIIPDDEIAYYQAEKMNALLEYVYDKYNPSYIVPIDDDEILTVDKGEIKKEIKSLPDGNVYFVKWINYVCSEKDNLDVISVPGRMRYRFEETNLKPSEYTTKIIISGGAIRNNPNMRIVQGNHGVQDYKGSQKLEDKIFMAHYPVRSSEQLKSKALVGWTGYLSMVTNTNNMGVQWKTAYEISKKGISMPVEVLKFYTKVYLNKNDENIKEKYAPINLPAECMITKYTNRNEVNATENYCNCVEELAKRYVELARKDLLGE